MNCVITIISHAVLKRINVKEILTDKNKQCFG